MRETDGEREGESFRGIEADYCLYVSAQRVLCVTLTSSELDTPILRSGTSVLARSFLVWFGWEVDRLLADEFYLRNQAERFTLISMVESRQLRGLYVLRRVSLVCGDSIS